MLSFLPWIANYSALTVPHLATSEDEDPPDSVGTPRIFFGLFDKPKHKHGYGDYDLHEEDGYGECKCCKDNKLEALATIPFLLLIVGLLILLIILQLANPGGRRRRRRRSATFGVSSPHYFTSQVRATNV